MPGSLYILLEGNDDERFFDKIIKPRFQGKYDLVKLWKYSQQKTNKIGRYIRAINSMGADYIYVADINNAPCVTARKCSISISCPQASKNNIIVVIKEIESWYIAGLDDNTCRKLRIARTSTDDITKEQFNQLIPKNATRTEVMIDILMNYHLDVAQERNKSLQYFLEKWLA